MVSKAKGYRGRRSKLFRYAKDARMKAQVWATTQPMEEPELWPHMIDMFDWIGWDRALFATDYPHWDFDHPERALPVRLDEERKQKFFLQNALELYKPQPA